MVGSVGGSLISLSYMKATGKDFSSYELPFGTFLGAAAIAVALGLQQFMGWYPGM